MYNCTNPFSVSNESIYYYRSGSVYRASLNNSSITKYEINRNTGKFYMRAEKSLQLQMIILLQRLSVIPILKILILIQIQIPNRNQIISQIKMTVI